MPARMLASVAKVTVLCATELLSDRIHQWITWQAATEQPDLSVLTATPHAENAVLAFALILSRFVGLIGRAVNEEQFQKAESTAEDLSSIGVQLLQARMDVRAVSKMAGRRSMEVLAMLTKFANNNTVRSQADDEIARLGFDAFRTAFVSAIDDRPKIDDRYIFATMIDPLAEVWRIGVSAEFFIEFFDGLLAGRFEMLTNYELWLRDRPRSIALVLVGALVAKRTGDVELKNAVTDAAHWVKAQPSNPLGFTHFETNAASAYLGVEIPSS